MKGLTIYKASAGSGKTFTLTLEFLKQALRSPFNARLFRGMLAVTFTNKATEEMKGRILSSLNQLSIGGNKSMADILQADLGIEQGELQKRATMVQTAILHDYSHFSVTTIDKFFQKIIHAFVREAGLRPGFKLELDQNRLLEEAVDQLLAGLSEKPLVYDWVMRAVDERLERGAAWDVRRPLLENGSLVFSETFREFGPEFYDKIADSSFMQHYMGLLQDMVKDVDRQMTGLANTAMEEMSVYDLQIEDFPFGKSGFANYPRKVLRGDYEPGARVLEALNNFEKWYNKSTDEITKQSIGACFPMFNSLLTQLVSVFESNKENYYTAKAIINNFRLLGLLAEVESQVKKVASDNNLMPISETTYLLGKLIDGNETPFVYERTGNRYHTYMIDEFQDTSEAQWRNFRPLLSNSLSQGQFCMVVGDVKQSIYRWRNGDWRILAYKLTEDFKHFESHEKSLDTNWRSKPVPVEFNNELFTKLPVFLGSLIDKECGTGNMLKKIITEAYKDAIQKVPAELVPNDGYLSLAAYYANDEQTASQQVLERLPHLIAEIQDRGYSAGDIAILVRRAEEGQWASDCLLEHKRMSGDTLHCFDIVSQDTLFVARSGAVQLAVGLMRAIASPADQVNNAFINNALYLKGKQSDLSQRFGIELTDEVRQFLVSLQQLSLNEVFERIVSHFGLAENTEDLPFVQELHDELLQFSRNSLPEISAFLQWWDERGKQLKLTPSKAPNAINILTIHKAKGLQYPVVIVPFCNWSIKPHADTVIWAAPDVAPFNLLQHVPVRYGKILANSHFSTDYIRETIQSVVDNTNVLYVALTRPEDELHVMLPLSKSELDACNKDDAKLSNVAQAVHRMIRWDRGDDKFNFGKIEGEKIGNTIYFGKPSIRQGRKPETGKEVELASYPSTNYRKKLLIRYETEDYFPETITTPFQYRNYGTLMHRVFSYIETPADVVSAIDKLIEEGWLDSESRLQLEEKVHIALQHPLAAPWFDGSWQIKSEEFLLLPPDQQIGSGVSRRPDRVMLRHDTTLVVDYKFGALEQPDHARQVKTYVNLLTRMGYPNVLGYVWYVDNKKIEWID